MFRGKNYLESAKLIDRSKAYDATDAFDLVIKASKAKFDDANPVLIVKKLKAKILASVDFFMIQLLPLIIFYNHI